VDKSVIPITEIKYIGLTQEHIEFATEACLLEPPDRAVVYYKVQKEWKHSGHDIHVKPGTISFGYFWSDKNYNVYHFISPDGNSLGLYINIAYNTIITPYSIEWHDLYLDVWIDTDGSVVILDEHEVPVTFDSDLIQLINNVKDDLIKDKFALAAEIEKQSQAYLIQML
jgi:protein associated with RNAse G/E